MNYDIAEPRHLANEAGDCLSWCPACKEILKGMQAATGLIAPSKQRQILPVKDEMACFVPEAYAWEIWEELKRLRGIVDARRLDAALIRKLRELSLHYEGDWRTVLQAAATRLEQRNTARSGEPRRYRHKKTGNIYELVTIGLDATNARDGAKVAIYRRPGTDATFVRELAEFNEKFELCTEEPLPASVSMEGQPMGDPHPCDLTAHGQHPVTGKPLADEP